MNKNKKHSTKSAFTIVELLVVIVVIGILAAITIVSYTGISNKATLASIQSDLNNSSNQLKLYYTEYSSYPATLNTDYCPTAPYSTTKYCLKASSGNTYTYSVATGVTNPQSYSLTATNTSSSAFGVVTNNSKPLIPNNTTAPLSPVADWLAIPTGEHYGNFYDSVTKQYASVTRATPKTIYDPSTQKIYDVPANQLAINPRSDNKSGYEAVIEEGRTNLLLNSNFGTGDFTNWSLDDKGIAIISIDSNQSVYGSKSVKIDKSLTSNSSCLFTSRFTVTGNVSYTASVYYKNSTFNGTVGEVYIRWYDSIGTRISDSSSSWPSSSATWVKNVNVVTSPSNAVSADFIIRAATPFVGQLWYNAAQVELGAFATSYIPTTTAVVTRNADNVTVPTTGWNASSGTMMAVGANTSESRTAYKLTWGNYNNGILINQNSNSGYNSQGWSGKSNVYAYANTNFTSAGVAAGAYYVQAGTWSQGAKVASYINGGYQALSTNNHDAFSSPPATAYVGSDNGYSGGANYLGIGLQRLAVYSSSLSSSDVSTVNNVIKDGP